MVFSLCVCFALSTQDLFSTAFDHQSYFNFFQGFKFERENVFLGQIPPRITGIKVVSSSKYYNKSIFNFFMTIGRFTYRPYLENGSDQLIVYRGIAR